MNDDVSEWPFIGRSDKHCLEINAENEAFLDPDLRSNITLEQSEIEMIFDVMDELGIQQMHENVLF